MLFGASTGALALGGAFDVIETWAWAFGHDRE